jgi:ribosomal protein S8
MNYRISELFKKEGYITSISSPSQTERTLTIELKYIGNDKTPCITNLKRLVRRPSLIPVVKISLVS